MIQNKICVATAVGFEITKPKASSRPIILSAPRLKQFKILLDNSMIKPAACLGQTSKTAGCVQRPAAQNVANFAIGSEGQSPLPTQHSLINTSVHGQPMYEKQRYEDAAMSPGQNTRQLARDLRFQNQTTKQQS